VTSPRDVALSSSSSSSSSEHWLLHRSAPTQARIIDIVGRHGLSLDVLCTSARQESSRWQGALCSEDRSGVCVIVSSSSSSSSGGGGGGGVSVKASSHHVRIYSVGGECQLCMSADRTDRGTVWRGDAASTDGGGQLTDDDRARATR